MLSLHMLGVMKVIVNNYLWRNLDMNRIQTKGWSLWQWIIDFSYLYVTYSIHIECVYDSCSYQSYHCHHLLLVSTYLLFEKKFILQLAIYFITIFKSTSNIYVCVYIYISIRTQITYSYPGVIKSQPVYKENRTLKVSNSCQHRCVENQSTTRALLQKFSENGYIGKLPRNNLSFIMLNL